VRAIKIVVTDDQLPAITQLLDDEGVDYLRQQGYAGDEQRWILEFPVPTDAISYLLTELDDAGLDEDQYTTITSLETGSTPHSDALEDRFAGDFDPLTRRELRSKAKDMSRDTTSFLAMTFLSAIIAVGGLLVGSAAVVVGSMVIAPLVGPVLTLAVGAVTGDRKMFVHSLWHQFGGVVVPVVGAFLITIGLDATGFFPTIVDITSIDLIESRTAPTLVTIVVGLVSGVAVVFGLTTKGPTSLIGVMIAAALIPAAATTGIGIAFGELREAVGALMLLLGTLVVIDISATVSLWAFGYQSKQEEWLFAKTGNWKVAVLTVLAMVLVGALVGAATVDQLYFQRTVTKEIQDTLAQPSYDHVSVVSFRVPYSTTMIESPHQVTVVVTREAGTQRPPGLADTLDRQISEATGRDTTVRVQYQVYHESSPGTNVSAESRLPSPEVRTVLP
jgi:uncharacterized hydrophobic protein (TIGR00341 family)